MKDYARPLRQDEIKALCAQNEAIRNCWEALRKQPQFNLVKYNVMEMFSLAHFALPIDEVEIIFKRGYRFHKYVVEINKGNTKITLYENIR